MPVPDKDVHRAVSQSGGGKTLLFHQAVGPELAQVQWRMEQLMVSPDAMIQQCLSYLGRQTGKMLRPSLVLLSGQCTGPITDQHIDMAAMVEFVHQASLLHDDVIDSADRRRACTTANALWGNTTAVLLGDFFLTQAFFLGTRAQCPAVCEILSATAQELCSGELMQNFQKGNWDLSEQQYRQIIHAKTAVLFQSSCRIGAIVSGASTQQIESLGRFGLELGIAFQITDDLTDLLGTSETAGKTLGSDLRQGKLTLPLIHWLRSGKQTKAECLTQLEQPENAAGLVGVLREAGSLDYAAAQARKHIDHAIGAIADFEQGLAVDALVNLAESRLPA